MWKINDIFHIQELFRRIPNWKLTQNSKDVQLDQLKISFLLRKYEEKLITASRKR